MRTKLLKAIRWDIAKETEEESIRQLLPQLTSREPGFELLEKILPEPGKFSTALCAQ